MSYPVASAANGTILAGKEMLDLMGLMLEGAMTSVLDPSAPLPHPLVTQAPTG